MMFSEADRAWMRHAIRLAQMAAESNEIPVGAVLIQDHTIVAEGFNRSITDCDPSAHAEVVALRNGAKALNNYRLVATTLYVTLEPCLMCVGALVQARVYRVVFWYRGSEGGCGAKSLKGE